MFAWCLCTQAHINSGWASHLPCLVVWCAYRVLFRVCRVCTLSCSFVTHASRGCDTRALCANVCDADGVVCSLCVWCWPTTRARLRQCGMWWNGWYDTDDAFGVCVRVRLFAVWVEMMWKRLLCAGDDDIDFVWCCCCWRRLHGISFRIEAAWMCGGLDIELYCTHSDWLGDGWAIRHFKHLTLIVFLYYKIPVQIWRLTQSKNLNDKFR